MQALVLLDFLVLRGSEQSVQITQEELMYKLEDLETFSYTTPEGKDQGVNVRHRHAHTPLALVHQSKQELHGAMRALAQGLAQSADPRGLIHFLHVGPRLSRI